MPIGENIRLARRRQRLSQESLALKVGVHKNTVLRWEKDELEPKASDITGIASATGESPDRLLGWAPPGGVAEQPTPYRAEPLDAELLAAILTAIQEGLEARKVKLPPKVFGTLVATIYEAALQEAALREDLSSRIQPFIRLALAGAG